MKENFTVAIFTKEKLRCCNIHKRKTSLWKHSERKSFIVAICMKETFTVAAVMKKTIRCRRIQQPNVEV